jgi:putative membrane protein
MSIIRTALALIGFGFTIFQFFHYLRETPGITRTISVSAPRTFGMTLVLLGNAILILGIYEHVKFMWNLRKERKALIAADLVHDDVPFVLSVTLLIGIVLLGLGIAATLGMIVKFGPLS